MYDAEAAASGARRRGPSWNVSDGVAGWDGIELDDVGVAVGDPCLTNGKNVEVMRRDHVLQQRTFVDDGTCVDEAVANEGSRVGFDTGDHEWQSGKKR